MAKKAEVGVVEPRPMFPAPLSVTREYLLVMVPAPVGAARYCPQ